MSHEVFIRYMPRTVAEMELSKLSSCKVTPVELDVFGVRRGYHLPGFEHPVGYTRIFDEDTLDEVNGMMWVDMDVLTVLLRKGEGRELVSFDRENPKVNIYFENNKPALFCAYPQDGDIEKVDSFMRGNQGCFSSACRSYAEAPKTRDIPEWIRVAGDDEGIAGDFFAASTEELIRVLAGLNSYPFRE